jgi:nucleoside-diphosphate-sugar epimerase
MSRIGVTGASGYIGAALTARLRAGGHDVVALGRRPVAGAVEFRPAHLDQPVRAGLADGLDGLVHLAADTRGGDVAAGSEVAFARDLVGEARRAGVPLLFASSQAASVQAPSAYGRTKAAIEPLVLAGGGVVVRPGLVYGGADAGLYGLLARMVSKLPLLPALVAPTPHVEPVHVDDVAAALAQLVLHPPSVETPDTARIFRLGGPSIAFGAFLQAIARHRFGRRAATVPVPVFALRALLHVTAPVFGPRLSPQRLDSLVRLPALGDGPGLLALGIVPMELADGLRDRSRPHRALLLEARRLARAQLGAPAPASLWRRYARALRAHGVRDAFGLPAWLGPALLAALDVRAARGAAVVGSLAWRLGVISRLAESEPRLARYFLRSGATRHPFGALAAFSSAALLELRARLLAPLARFGARSR